MTTLTYHKIMSVRRVANVLDMHPDTVRRWAEDGKLRFRMHGTMHVFDADYIHGLSGKAELEGEPELEQKAEEPQPRPEPSPLCSRSRHLTRASLSRAGANNRHRRQIMFQWRLERGAMGKNTDLYTLMVLDI